MFLLIKRERNESPQELSCLIITIKFAVPPSLFLMEHNVRNKIGFVFSILYGRK